MCKHLKPFLLNFSFRIIPHKRIEDFSEEDFSIEKSANYYRSSCITENGQKFVFLKIFGKVLEGKPQKNSYFLNGSAIKALPPPPPWVFM